MALDATVGGPVSNAYVDVATASALLSEQLYTEDWTDATPADQETALIWATRLLDEQVLWAGTPTTTTQALAWPRTGVVDCRGLPVDPMTIPVDLQRATATYAMALLGDEQGGSTSVPTGTVKRTQLGDTSVEYFQPGTSQTAQSSSPVTQVPAQVRQMLACYGRVARGLSIPVLRT